MNALDVSRWLWDFYLLSTCLLTAALVACLVVKQPARRMAIAWATAGGLLVLLLLTALPNWSRYSLASPAPAVVPVVEHSEPMAMTAPQVEIVAPRDTQPQPLVEPAPVRVSAPFDWQRLVLPLLAGGSLAVIGWLGLGSWQARRLRGKALTAPSGVMELFSQLAHDRDQPIELGVHRELPVAVALGLRRPCILLPQTLIDQANAGQLRSVLAHELAHVEHRDLWLLAVLRLLMVVLWPHPLFWLLRRRVRHDQEVLADTAAAALTSRTDYAEQLVALARSAIDTRVPRLASSVGLWEKPSQLTKRIKLLLDEQLTILRNCSRGWRIGSAGMLAALALGLSLVTLSPAETQDSVPDEQQSMKEAKEGASAEPTPRTTDGPHYVELRKSAKPNSILGFCLDENSQPLEGVEVELYIRPLRAKVAEQQKVRSTTSDAEGKFTFASVVDIAKKFPGGFKKQDVVFPPENTRIFEMVGRQEGRVTRFSNAMVSRVAQFGDVVIMSLPPSQTLRGNIVDEQGRPVVDAEVAFSPVPAGIAQPYFTTKSAADGGFVISNMESYDAAEARAAYEREHGDVRNDRRYPTWLPWQRFLTISHPKFATKRVSIDSVPGRMQITLEVGTILTGRVLKQEHGGSPEPAANVELHVKGQMSDWRTGEDPRPITLHIATNSGGEYRTEAIEAGPVTVTANAAGWFGKPVELLAEADKFNKAPDIILTRGGRIRIHLIDDETGKPLEFPMPTKAFVVPQPLPRGEISTVVEFSREGVGEQQLPSGAYHFLVSVPETNGQTELKDKLFATIRDIDTLDQHPTYEVIEGEVRDIEVRMVREEPIANATLKSTITPSAEPPAEIGPTGNLIPATSPAETEASDNSDKHTAIPPKLLYLAWRLGDVREDPKEWPALTLWDLTGKTLGAAEAKEFLSRLPGPTTRPALPGDLPLLVMFFEVDPAIQSSVKPSLSHGGFRAANSFAYGRPLGNLNFAVVTANSGESGAAWPEKTDIELNYALENWEVVKTVDQIGAQPIEIADGVRWYLDPTKAREHDLQTGRLMIAPDKTAAVLEIRDDVYHGLTNYASRIFAKKQTRNPETAYSTINTLNGKNFIVEVSDAFDGADQIERVIFLSQRRAIEKIDNVPLRLDLLPKDGNRRYVPITRTDGSHIDREAYENGVFVPDETADILRWNQESKWKLLPVDPAPKFKE